MSQQINLEDKRTIFNIILLLTDKGTIKWSQHESMYESNIDCGLHMSLSINSRLLILSCLDTGIEFSRIELTANSCSQLNTVIQSKYNLAHANCLSELLQIAINCGVIPSNCTDVEDVEEDTHCDDGEDPIDPPTPPSECDCVTYIVNRKAELERQLAALGNNGNARRDLQAKIDEDTYLIEQLRLLEA